MDCRNLVAAIDALLFLVPARDESGSVPRALDYAEIKQLDELDARIYFTAPRCGLAIPRPESEQSDCRRYGHTQIPIFPGSPGLLCIAEPAWRNAMAGLRSDGENLIDAADPSDFDPFDKLPASTRILAICRRLLGTVAGFYEAESVWCQPNLSSFVRHYAAAGTDTGAVLNEVEVIWAAVLGNAVSRNGKHAIDSAFNAAQRLQAGFRGLRPEIVSGLPMELFDDLRELAESLMPTECELCHEKFVAEYFDETACHDCHTAKGRLQSVSIALQCWWKYGQAIPPSLGNSVAWNDLRQLLFDLFGVQFGDRPNANDAGTQQKGWADFEDFLRREKPAGIDEHQWRNTVLFTPIEDVVTFLRAKLDERAGSPAPTSEASSDKPMTVAERGTPRKQKRSTERGEGRVKLIAGLTKHHKYADGSCLNLEPIGNNELARLADVDQATASAFFKQQFGGHAKYKVICAKLATLVAAIKLLNGEFTPGLLYGSKPPGEDERDEGE